MCCLPCEIMRHWRRSLIAMSPLSPIGMPRGSSIITTFEVMDGGGDSDERSGADPAVHGDRCGGWTADDCGGRGLAGSRPRQVFRLRHAVVAEGAGGIDLASARPSEQPLDGARRSDARFWRWSATTMPVAVQSLVYRVAYCCGLGSGDEATMAVADTQILGSLP
jgi:hypothetical protein